MNKHSFFPSQSRGMVISKCQLQIYKLAPQNWQLKFKILNPNITAANVFKQVT